MVSFGWSNLWILKKILFTKDASFILHKNKLLDRIFFWNTIPICGSVFNKKVLFLIFQKEDKTQLNYLYIHTVVWRVDILVSSYSAFSPAESSATFLSFPKFVDMIADWFQRYSSRILGYQMWNTMLSSSVLVLCCLIFLESGLLMASFSFHDVDIKTIDPSFVLLYFSSVEESSKRTNILQTWLFYLLLLHFSTLSIFFVGFDTTHEAEEIRVSIWWLFNQKIWKKLWSMKLIQRRFSVYNYPLETYDTNFMCEKQLHSRFNTQFKWIIFRNSVQNRGPISR